MSYKTDNGLLPVGLSDVLAPDAAFEAFILEKLLKDFAEHGYERIAPPLIEFEDSLLTGIGSGLAKQTFRLMDPESQKMMGVRADMTPQIARIAESRLSKMPRPLRLSYAGQVLRVRGTQLRPERQFTQVGVELIGPNEVAADAEVIILAASALDKLGVSDLSIDLGLPKLVKEILSELKEDTKNYFLLRQALDRKDASAVAELSVDLHKDTKTALISLLNATGPANEALDALESLSFKGKADEGRTLLVNVIGSISTALPNLTLTVDPIENKGFEYHTGVTFTFFAKGVRGELGNGGRYLANNDSNKKNQEGATGFTLFMDTVLRALPVPTCKNKIYVPIETSLKKAKSLRSEGWITVGALSPEKNSIDEASRLGCKYVLQNNEIIKIAEISSK